MYFKYGNYQHGNNEVALARYEILPRRSRLGIRESTIFSMNIVGELQVTTPGATPAIAQAELTTKIQNLIAAYSEDYKDAGFYQDDNTPTPHVLLNNHADNMTGNIITRRNWPIGDQAEYASKRTYSISIQAEFRNSYNQIVDYSDSILRLGDGGSIIRWFNGRVAPSWLNEAPSSFVTYYHRGRAVALDAYPLAPPPMFSRPFLLGHLTRIGSKGPLRYKNMRRRYTTTWSYVYVRPTADTLLPF